MSQILYTYTKMFIWKSNLIGYSLFYHATWLTASISARLRPHFQGSYYDVTVWPRSSTETKAYGEWWFYHLLKIKSHTLLPAPSSILLSEKHKLEEGGKGYLGHAIALIEMEEAVVPSNITRLTYQPWAAFLQMSLKRQRRGMKRARPNSVLFKPPLFGVFCYIPLNLILTDI